MKILYLFSIPQTLFIILKLAHVISWSWGLVFLPLWTVIFLILCAAGWVAWYYWRKARRVKS